MRESKHIRSQNCRWLVVAITAFAVLVGSTRLSAKDLHQEPLRVLLSKIYVVQGVPITLYYDNLLLQHGASKFHFTTECEIGHAESNGWVFDCNDLTPGTYPIAIKAIDKNGQSIHFASEVLVSPPLSGRKSLSLLIVGDSLTNATHYPNRIAELLSENERLHWKMIGTNKARNATKGVRHEGYGGRTWSWFLNHYEPEPDGTVKKRSSPFVYLQSDGQPKIDLERYFQNNSEGSKPEVITILLGINDCFTASANPEELGAKKIKRMFENAALLIEAFSRSCPDAKIGICVIPPPNRRAEAFVASYQGKYPRDGWLTVLHQLQTEQIRRWSHLKRDHVSVIPIHLNLDTTVGYPESNAVHPNKIGYRQIGDSIYAWICAHL